MKNFFRAMSRGVRFTQNNPQIIYTLFLVIVIPLAFFFTGEQFLKVTRDNQDRLERSRIGLLQDTFALFAEENFDQVSYLEKQMRAVASKNETMVTFNLLGRPTDGAYPILASLDDHAPESTMEFDDPLTGALFDSTTGNPQHASYAGELFIGGVRYWRSVRAIENPETRQVSLYILTDMSM